MEQKNRIADPLLALAAGSGVQGTSTTQKSHVLLLSVFFVCTILLGFTPTSNANTPQIVHKMDGIVGTIVVIEDILSVNSNDPNNSITKIEVYSNTRMLVHEETQCHASICSTNVGHLTSADYFVVAYTQSGDTFSAHIFIQ